MYWKQRNLRTRFNVWIYFLVKVKYSKKNISCMYTQVTKPGHLICTFVHFVNLFLFVCFCSRDNKFKGPYLCSWLNMCELISQSKHSTAPTAGLDRFPIQVLNNCLFFNSSQNTVKPHKMSEEKKMTKMAKKTMRTTMYLKYKENMPSKIQKKIQI